jgi:hypothetical protein
MEHQFVYTVCCTDANYNPLNLYSALEIQKNPTAGGYQIRLNQKVNFVLKVTQLTSSDEGSFPMREDVVAQYVIDGEQKNESNIYDAYSATAELSTSSLGLMNPSINITTEETKYFLAHIDPKTSGDTTTYQTYKMSLDETKCNFIRYDGTQIKDIHKGDATLCSYFLANNAKLSSYFLVSVGSKGVRLNQ